MIDSPNKTKVNRRGRRADASGALTVADTVVLSLLAERSMHGYDLIAEYDRQEVVDWASVSKAQVYYALQKLGRLGFIAPVAGPEARRDRTVFAPTGLGRAALAAALRHPGWARGRAANPFTTWLGLSVDADAATVAVMLEARRSFLLADLARERESLAFIDTLDTTRARVGRHIVALVIHTIETELAWLDTLAARN